MSFSFSRRHVNPGLTAARLAAIDAIVEMARSDEDVDAAFAALRVLGVTEAELLCIRVSVPI